VKLMRLHWIVAVGLLAFASSARAQGEKIVVPDDPAEPVKSAELLGLLKQARTLVGNGHFEEAVSLLKQACGIERTMGGFRAVSQCELAKAFTKAGRIEEALASYRQVFKWDAKRNDLIVGTGSILGPSMDYAILLARAGKAEEAKAMYYFGMRNFNRQEIRDNEPVPMLVVFDADPEGVVWQYSPSMLEAAALLIKCTDSNLADRTAMYSRIAELAPDWFLLPMWKAARGWRSNVAPQLLAQATTSAKPGIEQDLVARYKVELAEHRAYVEAHDLVYVSDNRPMTDGNARRARMECLRPNVDLLKRLSVSG
jgi:tetratricopeptide (TPR) repeat protein